MALAVLVAITVSAALAARNSAGEIEHHTRLIGAFVGVHQSIGEMHRVEQLYTSEEGDRPALRRRFGEAEDRLARSLTILRRDGDADDGKLANTVTRHVRAYRAGNHRAFAAYDAGRGAQAERLDDRLVDPAMAALLQAINDPRRGHIGDATQDTGALRRSSDFLLQGVAIAVPCTMLALGALWAVMLTYRRRLDEATRDRIADLERAAYEDGLTGLGNRRGFGDALLELAGGGPEPVAAVMVELHGLKECNERHGHRFGDEQLVSLARALRTAADPGSVYRIGGAEFAAFLPDRTAWEAYGWIQGVQNDVRQHGIELRAGVGESIGGVDPQLLLDETSVALAHAMRTSRTAVVYTTDLARELEAPDRENEHYRETLASALAQAVDAKDSYTRSHSETVSNTCALIAEELGLEPRRVSRIRLAGLLHDVGKIGVPDEILAKPDPLDEEEYAVMKSHPVLGARIARSAELDGEAEWILHHHERMDGRGYPHGLTGDAIPLESRIILVADALEAMTSDRPYRAGRPEDEAFAELELHAGTQFDAKVVAALLRATRRRGERPRAGDPHPVRADLVPS